MTTRNTVLDYRIIIWPFGDAPKELQALSPHGGDEDWLALIPRNLLKIVASREGLCNDRLLDTPITLCAPCDVAKLKAPAKYGDAEVWIGAHA